MSDDGTQGLTIIAFIGSVFSPYYAHARHRRDRRDGAPVDPLDHCSINVALYGARGARWSMTERTRDAVTRSRTRLAIGPSALEWRDGRLHLALDEIAAPIPKRIRGTIVIDPGARPRHREALDVVGRHHWSVIAPSARATVDLRSPSLSWSGPAYLDHNRGTRALEDDFVRWDWSRAHLADARAAVLYDVERREGGPLSLSTAFDADGSHETFVAPPLTAMPKTGWGLRPTTRSAPTHAPTIAAMLEDGPFYARSVFGAEWLNESVAGVHEHLSLERFRRRWVRALLPFRMPRRR